MGGFSLWHWIIVVLVVLVLFGRGRISETMGDFGKGIKSFKKGLAEDETKPAAPPPAQQIPPPAAATAPTTEATPAPAANPTSTEN
jgi:sec-independent protein translocase protein TatA